MTFSLNTWFRDLLRPKIKRLRVAIYEDGKSSEIKNYDMHRQTQIMREIEKLWESPNRKLFWFDCELVEQKRLFGKSDPPTLYVYCYEPQKTNPVEKTSMNIPIRYRTKFIGTLFPLPLRWSKTIEVRFHLDL